MLMKLMFVDVEDVGRARLHTQSSCTTTSCTAARKRCSSRKYRYYCCARCHSCGCDSLESCWVSRSGGSSKPS
ncbi:uncharacterized protein M421DRAFT_171745 [Didymella exigua CBS 183.55]|uniref:Uncharacterized protein n=1 Tax=Didymella exigua CBS 183.55 TaxID=1150837 RepID=A0A6A5RH32_9PLEO|nr:uncharacterized protein M421DRAFT_171745 [Didymella exigua CBS 183.55]KAF1927625.1 hypothetical protein M421DRAFT_171745 [Didymella exigua CBS 183.55]